MNNRYIIQLVVVIASVLLGMILYPILLRKWKHFVEWLYLSSGGKTSEEKKQSTPSTKNEEIPSIVGKSKFVVGHSRTTATIEPKSDEREENAPIFAEKSEDDDPQMKDVSVPLERVDISENDSVDSDDEAVDLEVEDGASCASGVDFDELIKTGEVIRKENLTEEEKDQAGHVLYENQSTEMIDQVTAKDEATLNKVNALIHHHMKKYNLHTEEVLTSNSEDFENFDVEQLF